MSWKIKLTAWMLGLLSVACAQDANPETAIAISIKTDLGQELSSVRTRVYEVGVNSDSASPLADYPSQPASELSRPTVVTKGPHNEVLIVVQGLGADGMPLIIQRTRAQFLAQKTYNLPIFLGHTCKNKNCGESPGQTCYGSRQNGICEGACGPIPVGASAGLLDDVDSPLPTASWSPQTCTADAGPVVVQPVADAGCDGGGCMTPGRVDAGDAGVVCTPSSAGAPCNLVAQCGTCDPTSEACGIDQSGTIPSIGCVVPGNEREGVTCQHASDCGRGLTCVDSICKKFCDTDKDCGGSSRCAGVIAGSAQTPLNFRVCGQSCTGNGDCSSGCCMDSFCRASDKCPPDVVCGTAGQVCTVASDCCSATPYCNASASGTKACSATPSAPPSCSSAAGSDACGLCSDARCCVQWKDCTGNTDCSALLACFKKCTSGDTTCNTSCRTQHPTGVQIALTWSTCIDNSCSTQCM